MKKHHFAAVSGAAVLAFDAIASAQHHQAPTSNPYAGEQNRSLKALSLSEVQDYSQGRSMGLAKAAELNSYPGPMHVLELGEPLRLTPQ